MKGPKIIYMLISLYCVFAVGAGVYAQFIDEDHGGLDTVMEVAGVYTNTTSSSDDSEETQNELKVKFNNFFTNTLNLGDYDTTGIQKINKNEEIVYTYVEIQESNDRYELNINIPAININTDVATSLNSSTQTTFINKANEIISDTDSTVKIIYSIDYVAFINDNILSLVIRSTLKEGSSAQRIMIQTYNYNLETDEEVSLLDLVTLKMLNKDEVDEEIMEVVTEANEEAQILYDMGYSETYVRDLDSSIYSVDGANVYFLGPDGTLYIIYPYGNSEFTSTMDIIVFN